MTTAIIFLGINFFFNTETVSWWKMSPEVSREAINRRIIAIEAPTPAVGAVADYSIFSHGHKTPIRVYVPMEGNYFPVVLFIHGGAWVAGNLDTHDHLARYLCSKANIVVVSVGYLNAPEGKFPLPLEQCYSALMWITEHAQEIDVDTSRLAVVGDSAGADMAAAFCLMVRDRSGPKICLQVLINPDPDLTCNGIMEPQNDALDSLRWQMLQYLSDPRDAYHPYVSPLLADDLSNLPPAVVVLAERDARREVGQQYADRLRTAGVFTQVYCQEGVGHLAGHAARASHVARESLDVVVRSLN